MNSSIIESNGFPKNNCTTNGKGYKLICSYIFTSTETRDAQRFSWAILSVLGIAANIFTIVLAAKFIVRKKFHHLIINMAVADALYVFMSMMWNIDLLTNGRVDKYPDGPSGKVLCRFDVFMVETTCMVSVYNLLIISIERYQATSHVIQKAPSRMKHFAVLGISWLVPIPFAAYHAHSTCLTDHGKAIASHQFAMFANYILTTVVCFIAIFLSGLTIRRLARSHAAHEHLNEDQRKQRTQRTRSAVRMVLASVILYMSCWLPRFFFRSFRFLNETSAIDIAIMNFRVVCIDWFALEFMLLYIFPVLNSLFSPVIYIYFLADFREAAKKLLCCCCVQNLPLKQRTSSELKENADQPLTQETQ